MWSEDWAGRSDDVQESESQKKGVQKKERSSTTVVSFSCL